MTRRRFQFEFQPPQPEQLATAALGPALAIEAEQVVLAPHTPRLTPRDEAIYLLHATAEVEHALMVQYLYAAFSLQDVVPVRGWANTIFQIAVEEMGHLACMQNALIILGGPINLEREDFPFRSGLYPFPFRLEPLTLASLAKYIAAERPAIIADPDLEALYRAEIEPLTRADDDLGPVNRVGAVFERLLLLFRDPAEVAADDPTPPLQDEDFRTDVGAVLASADEWGQFNPSIIIGPSRDQISTAQDARAAVRDVLTRVAQQGEGYPSSSTELSHFDRFIGIWQQYRQHFSQSPVRHTGPGSPARAVPTDPVTSQANSFQAITNERSLGWARLFNLRYQMLLAYLQHFFQYQAPLTYRGKLNAWTFEEMARIRGFSTRLMNWPLGAETLADRAGPPFELRYTLVLPDRASDRWRTHRDLVDAAILLGDDLLQKEPAGPSPDKDYLTRLLAADRARREQLTRLMNGQPPEADPHNEFVNLLRAKQAQAKNRHAAINTPTGTLKSLFEQENYEDIIQFLLTEQTVLLEPNRRLVVPKQPEESGLFLQMRDGVMQGRFSNEELNVVQAWIMSLPDAPTTPLSFATDIRPLFRDSDIDAMLFVFDMSRFEDVRDNADAIHERLADGTMPCDAPWPADQVATFKAWIDQGKAP